MCCKKILVYVLMNKRGVWIVGEWLLGKLVYSDWLVSEASNLSDLLIRIIGLV